MRDRRTVHDEADLVRRLQMGDPAAPGELVAGYRSRVYQLALRYLRNPEDAEEVTQDVLVKAVAKIDAFRGDSALASWLFRITFNTAMSRLRRQSGASGEDGAGDGTMPDVPDWSAMADEVLLRRQLRWRLTNALRRLPAIYRVPVILRDVNGLSTEEASSVLHLNVPTLKSRLHRGRLLLRRELADFAGGLVLHRAVPFAHGA